MSIFFSYVPFVIIPHMEFMKSHAFQQSIISSSEAEHCHLFRYISASLFLLEYLDEEVKDQPLISYCYAIYF